MRTPRKIYFAPVNRLVAEFIGAANIVEVVQSWSA
jgi:ABC-type Fe3+/spermidine/putrescine transport system ATPase subunit